MGRYLAHSDGERSLDACPVVEVSLVVPVYNESATVGLFLERVDRALGGEPPVRLEVVFVNDGSSDSTLDRLLKYQQRDARVRVVDLSRNFGKEAALSAGMGVARGRVVVPIDVDLQDPPELVLEMIEQWRQGYDVVLARRVVRDADSRTKRISAAWFYRVHNWIAKPMIPENVGDFRLMDRITVDALNGLPESGRFMKGLFAWAGFRTTCIDYARPKRAAGSSKFDGRRLWGFALEGLMSFGPFPLRLWTYLGGMVALASFLYGLFIALRVLVVGVDTPGYASLFVAITFLGGLQLMGIGVIGEYLGKTYLEAKRRPAFLVRRIYEPDDCDR
ncbi:MAG: glycosyltransferase family 2 protein [Candidatus Thiosymbion ectosymbiont of Robbea hypermnestra]|nr:glycosyltransferase family 2 protein [Candidatus Thiosymbion ectosymbiont of Robbea hypermnestra]